MASLTNQVIRNLEELFVEAKNFSSLYPRENFQNLLSLTNSLKTLLGILDAELEREEEKGETKPK